MIRESKNITRLKELINFDNTSKEGDSINYMVDSLSKDGFWTWDLVDDSCYLSKSLKAMIGYPDSELAKHDDLIRLMVDRDKKRLERRLKEYFASDMNKPFHIVLNYNHKNGNIVKILCRGKVIQKGLDGEPRKMVGSYIDITDCKNI